MKPLAAACCLLFAAVPFLSADERPSIVIIMADDMGYSDLGCYGGEIDTPNLDRLAAEGVRFTQFYNAGRCCPTRASLLTGFYSHQAGIGLMTGDSGIPGYRGVLGGNCATIAEVLRPAGYVTMLSGKWHVGSAPEHWPLERGFDKFYGIPQGGGHYFRNLPGRQLVLQDKVIPIPDDWYATEGFTEHAVRFIEEEKDSDRPFFLYLAYTAPHWPLQAREKDIAKYANRYAAGWDQLRKERFARMVRAGLVSDQWQLSALEKPAIPWTEETKKDMMAARMAVYAAQVDALDQGIGEVLDALERTGRADRTVVMFLSDNGCSAEGGQKGFNDASRGDVNARLGSPESYVSAGLNWANACNTPYRKHKMMTHEGGIATPLIVSWPGKVAQPGGLSRRVGHVIDLLPTCVELGRADYPTGKTPLEGRSLVAALTGDASPREGDLFWEHQGNRAVRSGKWKLVAAHGTPWELYDLDADRTEQHDLAASDPERVADLSARYADWARRCGVEPWPLKPRNKR